VNKARGRLRKRAGPRGMLPYRTKEERAWVVSSSVGRLMVWAFGGLGASSIVTVTQERGGVRNDT
jgi:hypothetical protein